MKKSIRDRLRARKRRLEQRLDKFNYPEDLEQPMMRSGNVQYDVAGHGVGTAYGGIGLIHKLVQEIGLAEEIDRRLVLFKFHLPYHESDHVLNLAYNALCDGRCLEDLEQRRQDEAYLNLLGADRCNAEKISPIPRQPATSAAGSTCSICSSCTPPLMPRERRSGLGSQRSSSPKRGLMPTARWSAPPASAKKGWICRTRVCGAITR